MPRFIVTVEANGTTMPYRVEAKSEFDAQAYAEMKGYKVRDVELETPPVDKQTVQPTTQQWTAPNDGYVYLDPVVAEMRTTELRKQRRGAISSCIVGSVLILVLGTTCSPFAVNQMLHESQRNQSSKYFGIVLLVVLAASILWALAYTSKIRSLSRLISQIRTKP